MSNAAEIILGALEELYNQHRGKEKFARKVVRVLNTLPEGNEPKRYPHVQPYLQQDTSPNALEWCLSHQAPVEITEWVKTLDLTTTCREMWQKCPDARWLMWITMFLRGCYEPVLFYYGKTGKHQSDDIPAADEFRQKCAEFGCYGSQRYIPLKERNHRLKDSLAVHRQAV